MGRKIFCKSGPWYVSQPVCSRLWCTNPHNEKAGCKTQHMPWADGTVCSNLDAKETMVKYFNRRLKNFHFIDAACFQQSASVCNATASVRLSVRLSVPSITGKRYVDKVDKQQRRLAAIDR